MNIFILDQDVKINAQSHCNKHISKMIIEAAQILCTVKSSIDNVETHYKPTHLHHPSTQWVMSKGANWDYLVNLATELNNEYCYRYNKHIHKSFEVIKQLIKPTYKIQGKLSSFVFVDGDNTFKGCLDDVINAYRHRYIQKNTEFKHPMKFGKIGNRLSPVWMEV